MHPPQAGEQGRRKENLAYVFQEILTVIERLRAHRQTVTDANAFRQQIRAALKAADDEGRRRGYAAEEIQLCIFAAVAFLDESVLNLRSPVFADWPRQPLQEEYFGHHVAGDVFFQNLQKLLGQNDSHVLADVLEVYHLCMLLGFAGRYAIGARGELRTMIDATAAKIRRIRGDVGGISPAWTLPPGALPSAGGDPHLMKFVLGAIVCLLLALTLFFSFHFILGKDVSAVQEIATKGRS